MNSNFFDTIGRIGQAMQLAQRGQFAGIAILQKKMVLVILQPQATTKQEVARSTSFVKLAKTLEARYPRAIFVNDLDTIKIVRQLWQAGCISAYKEVLEVLPKKMQ